MSIWGGANNPGLDGINELTSAEETFIQNLAGLSYAQGDILYRGVSNLNRLAAGTNGFFLKTQGAGANPIWASISRAIQTIVFNFTVSVATGDGKSYFHIDSRLGGMNLVDAHAEVITAGTTGVTTIQIANVTQGADMLSTRLTIDSGETGSHTAATPAVIDTANDDVAENDVLRVDVDTVSGTAPKGLIVTLGFILP